MPSSYIWYENVFNRLSMLGYNGSIYKGLKGDYIVFYYNNRRIFIEGSGQFYEEEEWKYWDEGTGRHHEFSVNGERFVTYGVKPKIPGESDYDRTVSIKSMRTISNIEIFHIAEFVREAICYKHDKLDFRYSGDLKELDEFRVPYKKIDDTIVQISSWFLVAYDRDNYSGINPLRRIKLALRH